MLVSLNSYQRPTQGVHADEHVRVNACVRDWCNICRPHTPTSPLCSRRITPTLLRRLAHLLPAGDRDGLRLRLGVDVRARVRALSNEGVVVARLRCARVHQHAHEAVQVVLARVHAVLGRRRSLLASLCSLDPLNVRAWACVSVLVWRCAYESARAQVCVLTCKPSFV